MFVRRGCVPGVIAGAIVLAACAASAPGFTIVRNGRAACRIVVASPAHPAERFAADELRRYIRTITDVDLDIRMEGTAGAGPVISIGETRRSKYKNIKIESRYEGDDAFVIEPFGADLVIKGATPRGTLYGVYALLEGIGSRWLVPGDPVGLQPGDRHDRRRTVANIEWTALKIPEAPDFPLRILQSPEPGKLLDLACKRRLNIIALDFGAMITGEDPLWADTLAGIRKRGMEAMVTDFRLADPPSNAKLCVSTPDDQVALWMADHLAKVFEGVSYWSLKLGTQAGGWCDCDACRKIGTTADRAYYLQNRIAERIRKRRGRKPTTYLMPARRASVVAPDFRRIEALTGGQHVDYVWFTFPDRFRTHTVFDTDECKRTANPQAYAELLKYVKHFKGKVVVDGGYSDPRRSYRLHPLGGVIAEEARHFHKLGIAGMSVHADRVGFDSAALNHAVLSRLLWKRREPLERIRRDFLQSLYGPQWEKAAEVYDGFEKRAVAFDGTCIPAELQRSTVKFLTTAVGDLKDKRGKTKFQTEQVERLRLMVQYARAVEHRDVEAFVKIATDMVRRDMLPGTERRESSIASFLESVAEVSADDLILNEWGMDEVLRDIFGVSDETKRKRLLDRMGTGTR